MNRLLVSLVFSVFGLTPAVAEEPNSAAKGNITIAVTSGIPSDMIGLELGVDMNENLGFRAGVGGVKFNNVEIEGLKADLDTFGGSGFVDYYPGGGIFRFSAGGHVGNLDLEVTDGIETGSLKYQNFRPAVSIGLASRESAFYRFADIGVSYLGKPDVSISGLDADTQADARDIADSYRYSLLLRAGLGIRF